MSKEFEYKIILIGDLIKMGNEDKPETGLEDGLNFFGHQGWELCSIWGTNENSHFIFKKEVK